MYSVKDGNVLNSRGCRTLTSRNLGDVRIWFWGETSWGLVLWLSLPSKRIFTQMACDQSINTATFLKKARIRASYKHARMSALKVCGEPQEWQGVLWHERRGQKQARVAPAQGTGEDLHLGSKPGIWSHRTVWTRARSLNFYSVCSGMRAAESEQMGYWHFFLRSSWLLGKQCPIGSKERKQRAEVGEGSRLKMRRVGAKMEKM